jgi:hypothetical protein
MRSQQGIRLGLSFVAGLFWVFVVQKWMFLNVFSGVLAGPGLPLNDYLQLANEPAFTMLWISCISALMIWLWITFRARPCNGAEVRRMKPLWWTAAVILVLLGWLYQLFFSIIIWQLQGQSPVQGSGMNFFLLPPGGWLLLTMMVMINVALLFWLPTLMASPRTYRLVVPGAVKILGGR